MASQSPPKINTAYTFYVSLVSQSDTKTFQANPTLASGDVKVAIDDGAPANLATLPVVDADYTKRVKVALSSGEMNGDNITVIFSDASGAEWCDLTVNLQTVTNQFDDLATATNLNTVDTVVDGIKAVTDNLPNSGALSSLATASALSTAQADLDTLTGTDGATLATSQPNYAPATATALALVAGYVDTEVAAIKAKTDNLPAAPAATGDIPTAAQVRAEMDSNSTQLAAIVADTDELQGDWANGGRLDLLIDAILADTAALNDTALPDSVPADGTMPTLKQAVYMVTQFLLERAVSGTTVTVKKVDGSTSLMTLTLNDGTSPTSITRSG